MNDFEEMIDLETHDFGTTIAGIAGFLMLFVFGGFWLYNTELSGAIIVPGKVDIMGEAKIVQHRDGGVVSSILVEPGEAVQKGQLLVELDVVEHRIRANATAEKMKHLSARLYRLHAERKNADLIDPPTAKPTKINFVSAANNELSLEHDLMRMRRANLAAKRLRGEIKLKQLQNRVVGFDAQSASKQEEHKLLQQEFEAKKTLYAKGYSSLAALRKTQISISLIQGSIRKLSAEKATLQHSIEETKVAMRNDEIEFHETVLTEIISTQAQTRELKKNLMTDKTIIDRAGIRAPTSGTIHKMEVFTVGGVISPSQELMQIVPQDSALEIGASLETRYVDDVAVNQKAVIRLSGFDARSTPELNALVRWISPDVVTDPQTGVPYYKIKVKVPPEELKKLNADKLVPGMPAEIFINTGERTAFQYLTEPLIGQLRRAFKE